MEFPKKIMKRTELLKLGVPKQVLENASSNTKIAWRMSPDKPKSPYIFDTDKLKEFMEKDQKNCELIIKRRCVC